ncbi:MAG: HNH endonuclease signature motif containing protein [Candidatus Nanopelagicales bacterium]
MKRDPHDEPPGGLCGGAGPADVVEESTAPEPAPEPDVSVGRFTTGGGGAGELTALLLTGAGECGPQVRDLVARLAVIATTPIPVGLGTDRQLRHEVTAVARLRQVLDTVLGDRVDAATRHDALRYSPTTVVTRDAGWDGAAASSLVAASRLAARYPALRDLWVTAQISTAHLAVLARGITCLTEVQTRALIAAVLPSLPLLTVPALRLAVRHGVDLLRPHDSDHAAQHDWQQRSVTFSHHAGMVLMAADLPAVEGEALIAALTALADSLRVDGDALTTPQRRADALITLINQAATYGDLPATRGGIPVAATITIGLPEAERITDHHLRPTPATPADLTTAAAHHAHHATTSGPTTLGDAAARFALCAGVLTGALVDDSRHRHPLTGHLGRSHLTPLALGRTTRLATPTQRTALALRDHGCLLCQRPPAECQTHHVTPWTEGGATDIDTMTLLCWAHHRAVDLNFAGE